MRKVVFVLAVAMVIGIVGVVLYDRNNAPQPQLVNTPVHVLSEGTVRICVEDRVDDRYQTKVTASTGHLKEFRELYYNTGSSQHGNLVTVRDNKRCLAYTAPWVEKPTTLLLRAWQNGAITDEAKVKLMPNTF